MKCRLSLQDYGASIGKYPKGFCSRSYAAADKSVESQLPPIFMSKRCHVFHPFFFILALVIDA